MQVLVNGLVIFLSTLLSAGCLPTTTEPAEPHLIPLEFPNFNQNYTFIDNSSIRENLVSHSDIDTEIDDLLGKNNLSEQIKTDELPEQKKSDEPPKQKKSNELPEQAKPDNPPEQAKSDEPLDSLEPQIEEETEQKNDTEWIEDGENTEDRLQEINPIVTLSELPKRISTIIPNEKKSKFDSIPNEQTDPYTETKATHVTKQILKAQQIENYQEYQDGAGVINGTLAAILVGVFLIISILGYIVLILWRRSLELKYGSREILVDKDDFFDPDNMKHFSI